MVMHKQNIENVIYAAIIFDNCFFFWRVFEFVYTKMSFDDELCRICLSKDNLTDLLSPENAQIHENLQSLVFIDVNS